MDPGTDRPLVSPSGVARRELQLTLASVAFFLAGIAAVGHRDGGWPIVTWPMYSTYTPSRPSALASRYEIRVVDVDSTVHVFSVRDFAPTGWIKAAAQIFQSAYQDSQPVQRDSSRVYIVSVVLRSMPARRIARIEGWRRDWSSDPMATPPIDYDRPLRDVRVGAFAVPDYVRATHPDR